MAGNILSHIEGLEAAFDPLKILIIQRPEFGREASMVDRARLMEARVHPSIMLAERYEPRPAPVLGGRWNDEIETVS
jgi:hypothetical protein